ncbi:multiheme c-type cytochrome [Desulfopila aestuarii]|nr:multiheme c-type cytochrome [Desulfopila aestuarii]
MLVKRPQQLYVTSSGAVDMCLSCHTEEKLDRAHDVEMIGCSPCHLGNPLAITKEEAHQEMVVNPGDLRIVDKTCSVEGCHPADVHKVKNSLMATNRGILGTLLFYWGESDSQNTDLTVEELIASGHNSFALDYYRKLCGTCHLWKQKNDIPDAPDFFNEKGGGCSACHFLIPETEIKAAESLVADTASEEEKAKKIHPHITAKVDQNNCIRCHNRSGRIGLSYIGIFESEGYGTPYEKGGMTRNQLPGARFYLEIADDIHHNKGMQCIDCHTRNEIMGDGTSYAHYEEQLEISCEVCHSTNPGTTRKNNVLNNLAGTNETPLLKGKIDGVMRPLRPPRPGVCDFSPHKRVSCEACHSTWVPQCYGCHVKQDQRGKHLDKLSLKETAGLWEEGRSYIRYEKPMLGIWENEVVIVTPGCQDMVTVVGKDGKDSGGFNRFTMAAINPHTTQKKGRECVDCHASPKTVGLGEGTIYQQDGKLAFRSMSRGIETSSGRTVPLDAWVDIEGEQLQHGSRPNVRPFNKKELQKILQVGLCAGCHDSYQDPLWTNYTADMACPVTTQAKGRKNETSKK